MELLDKEGVETLWSKIKTKIETINNSINQDLTNNYVTKTEFLAVSNKVNSQQTTIESMQTDISNLEKALTEANNKITQLTKSVESINTVLGGLESKYLRKDINDTTAYTITAKALYKS